MAIATSPKLDEKEPFILTESDDLGTGLDSDELDSTTDRDDDDIDVEPKLEPQEDTSLSSSSTSSQHDPPPSALKRFALIMFIVLLFFLASSWRQSPLFSKTKKAPQVIYASRYSKEHKFRPAASPIITETLKDGRVRIRGAGPTATPQPTIKKAKSKPRAAAATRSKRRVGSKGSTVKTRSQSKVPVKRPKRRPS